MSRNVSDNLISPRAADQLISMRDGEATLLYLYFCRNGFHDPERARKELYMTRQRFQEACERLEMQGLLTRIGAGEISPAVDVPAEKQPPVAADIPGQNGDLPPYSAVDVSTRVGVDSAFAAVLAEAKLILGRPLSTPDLIKMLGIYDHFGLPAEVMMELMHFVADNYRERYQEKRRPTVGAFEKEARIWADRDIRDFDAAERYIQRCRERRSLEGALKEAMQIVNRDFTYTERGLISQWLDWGFQPDAIALAYDVTVTNTRKFSSKYMNRVLENWHKAGLHTVQEIRDKDRPLQVKAASGKTGTSGPIDPRKLDDIKKAMNGWKKD